jgi:hypothetical protein
MAGAAPAESGAAADRFRKVDLPAILNRHRAQLRFGVHPDRGLQRDWDELGPEAFAFEILDTLSPPEGTDYDPTEDLRVLLELWSEKLSLSQEHCYRVTPKR